MVRGPEQVYTNLTPGLYVRSYCSGLDQVLLIWRLGLARSPTAPAPPKNLLDVDLRGMPTSAPRPMGTAGWPEGTASAAEPTSNHPDRGRGSHSWSKVAAGLNTHPSWFGAECLKDLWNHKAGATHYIYIYICIYVDILVPPQRSAFFAANRDSEPDLLSS